MVASAVTEPLRFGLVRVRTEGAFCVLAVAFAVWLGLSASAYAATVNFAATIDGPQETTCAMASTAQGAATVTLDDVTGVLSWNITFGNNAPLYNNGTLDFGAELASHFHGPASPGMTAGI